MDSQGPLTPGKLWPTLQLHRAQQVRGGQCIADREARLVGQCGGVGSDLVEAGDGAQGRQCIKACSWVTCLLWRVLRARLAHRQRV